MNDNASIFRDGHFLPWPAHAGFPSPADDYKERPLDLNGLVVPQPVSTYFMRVAGDSMIHTCIYSGDSGSSMRTHIRKSNLTYTPERVCTN
jgi:hypothetical protein